MSAIREAIDRDIRLRNISLDNKSGIHLTHGENAWEQPTQTYSDILRQAEKEIYEGEDLKCL